MLFSKALLNATYKNGRPPNLTDEHAKAENHPFKTDFMFKNKAIPKEYYASRLIQHYFIIKSIEDQLQHLSETDKSSISAFFALSYLKQLWRTPGIEQDLQELDVDPNQIQQSQIAKSTVDYLNDIKQLPPKALLAHFLLHIAGFMHGGNIIQSKYINPSNEVTSYQIPANQYDFSSAISFLPTDRKSPMVLYHDLVAEVDKIEVDETEFEELLKQCKGIYQTMSDIYDDLCVMHTHQPQQSSSMLAYFSVGLVAFTLFLKLLFDVLGPLPENPSYQPN